MTSWTQLGTSSPLLLLSLMYSGSLWCKRTCKSIVTLKSRLFFCLNVCNAWPWGITKTYKPQPQCLVFQRLSKWVLHPSRDALDKMCEKGWGKRVSELASYFPAGWRGRKAACTSLTWLLLAWSHTRDMGECLLRFVLRATKVQYKMIQQAEEEEEDKRKTREEKREKGRRREDKTTPHLGLL